MAILREGQLLIITGHMGHGKSHFAVVIVEGASNNGYHIYTNINFFKEESWEQAKRKKLLKSYIEYRNPPSNVHVCNKMSELLLGLTKTSPNVVILDEAMIFAGFDRHGSKILRWFKDFVTQCRKLNTSVVLITQVKSQLTRMLREQLEHYECFCYKKGKDYIIKLDRYFPFDFEALDTIHGPRAKQTMVSSLPYDTKSPASLQMDIDMEGFLGDASCYDSIELVDHVEELVDKWRFNIEPKKKKEDKSDNIQIAKNLKKEGKSLSEIAETMDKSERQISRYLVGRTC